MDKESTIRVDVAIALIEDFERKTLTRINKFEQETLASISEIKNDLKKIDR